MTELHFAPLAPPLKPLLDKFYRAHRSPMRAPSGAQVWVARRQDIVAALCLTPVDGGHWLTGLLVAPSERRHGLASQLVELALARTPGPVWLFCHPDLVGFYQRLGFAPATQLPAALAERLARYQRNKSLVALGHTGPRC
jgi:GNAT superfamily N-acetyltransferase